MGWAERQNKQEKGRTAIIVFPNDELREEFSDFTKRTRALLETVKTFSDSSCELNENAPDFFKKMEPIIEKFFTDIMLNYASFNQIEADLETLAQVRVSVDSPKK